MDTCGYTRVCDEADRDGQNVYECDRDTVGEGDYCELHDASYLDGGDPNVVLEALMDEVRRSRRLVGFHLPSVALSNMLDSHLYFEGCKFRALVDFSNANWAAPITFNSCVFMGGANFTRSKFIHPLYFKNIKSDPKTRFDFRESNLLGVQITGSAFPTSDFSLARLSSARFTANKFTGDVSMADAKLDDCSFLDNTFEKQAMFTAAKFSRCIFKNENFKSATFKSSIFISNEVSIIDADMSNTSLAGADLSGVKFTDRTKWDGDRHNRIYDAHMFYSNPTPDGFVAALAVLRALRDNHEYHLMYRTAGRFFVQEMDIKRNYFLRGNTVSRHFLPSRLFSLTGLYFWICGYGESFKRVGFWITMLFGTALGSFALQFELLPVHDPAHASLGVWEKAAMHLKRTLAAFFPLGGGDLSDYVVRIASIPLLGTLFIVIRRRFERKLRH